MGKIKGWKKLNGHPESKRDTSINYWYNENLRKSVSIARSHPNG